MTQKTTNPGLVLAFGSALSFSLLNAAVRYAQDDLALSTWGILLTRGLTSLVAAFLISRYFGQRLITEGSRIFGLVGFLSFLSSVATTFSIGQLPLYQVLVMLYLYPAMTVPLGYFILGQKVGRRDILLVAAAFGGCVILLWPDDAAGLKLTPCHLVALGGSVFYALAYVLTNKASTANNGFQPVFYYGLWAVVGNLVIIFGLGADTGLKAETTLLPAMGLGVLAVTALLTGYAALRWLPAFKVGVIGTLEVLGGVLASWLFFDDPITVRALTGGAIILGAALMLRKSD